MKFFYGRVSSTSQNLATQLEKAKELGIEPENVFTDKMSGKNTDRPALQDLLSRLRPQDELYVSRLDRLARSTKDLLELADTLEKKGVTLVSVSENLRFDDSAQGILMFQMFSVIAEFQRNLIKQNQRAGIDLAIKENRYSGRPPKPQKSKDLAVDMYLTGKYKMKEIEEATGLSYGTIYNEIKKRGVKRVP